MKLPDRIIAGWFAPFGVVIVLGFHRRELISQEPVSQTRAREPTLMNDIPFLKRRTRHLTTPSTYRHNQSAGRPTLRMVFGLSRDDCSASLRNSVHGSPRFHGMEMAVRHALEEDE